MRTFLVLFLDLFLRLFHSFVAYNAYTRGWRAAEAERDEDALSSLVGGASAMDDNFQLVDTSRVQRPMYQKMKIKQQQVRYLCTPLDRD